MLNFSNLEGLVLRRVVQMSLVFHWKFKNLDHLGLCHLGDVIGEVLSDYLRKLLLHRPFLEACDFFQCSHDHFYGALIISQLAMIRIPSWGRRPLAAEVLDRILR